MCNNAHISDRVFEPLKIVLSSRGTIMIEVNTGVKSEHEMHAKSVIVQYVLWL